VNLQGKDKDFPARAGRDERLLLQTLVMCNFVAYYRVSTERQGRSGLGLEAQEAAVDAFVASRPDAKLIAPPFKEIESGKKNDRPQLAKALHRAKVTGSTLLIAKLDRLSRNAAFLMNLRDAGVSFVAVDLPEANTLTIGIMALMAQHEREAISARTKAALQAAKARGVQLGSRTGGIHLRGHDYHRAGVEAQKAKANDRANDLADVLADLVSEGIVSANAQATALNDRGIITARGGKWTARSVINVMERMK
jgi:DNA invertase Pin-like site-specific DNA recombinase